MNIKTESMDGMIEYTFDVSGYENEVTVFIYAPNLTEPRKVRATVYYKDYEIRTTALTYGVEGWDSIDMLITLVEKASFISDLPVLRRAYGILQANRTKQLKKEVV